MPHADHSKMRLGLRPAKHDQRTLRLAKYVQALPPAPEVVDWTAKVASWPMHMNDKIGCCALATASHQIRAWSANSPNGGEVHLTDADVLEAYKSVGGYRPGRPFSDRGCVELNVLRYWRTHGIGGHKIGAFVGVSPKNRESIKDAIWLFGGLYTGFALPRSARTQTVWDVPLGGAVGSGSRNSWGGHAVPILQADARGVTCVTWGALKRLSWAFVEAYMDEAYAIISQDFLDDGKSPSGFDLVALTEDLAEVAG